jgi:hypothetical protein
VLRFFHRHFKRAEEGRGFRRARPSFHDCFPALSPFQSKKAMILFIPREFGITELSLILTSSFSAVPDWPVPPYSSMSEQCLNLSALNSGRYVVFGS